MTTEVEFGGVKFTGGKVFALITALSTLGGASCGGFFGLQRLYRYEGN